MTKLNGEQSTPENKTPVFNVHSMYLKDLSFEAPRSPAVFQEEWKPKVDFDMQMGSQVLSEDEGIYEVVLHLTVNVQLGEGEKSYSACVVEVKQAGIFMLQHFSNEEVKHILATNCPAVLFPYVRENISSLATRGGFPQLVLPPIDFNAMYAQHLMQQSAEEKVDA